MTENEGKKSKTNRRKKWPKIEEKTAKKMLGTSAKN